MLQIAPLKIQDIPAARRLSDQANWNHLDADWLRLITLWPETCLAGWLDGKLIATATLATFNGAPPAEALAWVGVMLVDTQHRGAGHGSKMFDAVLQLGEDRNLKNFGLDATDMGRPLYAKRNFQDLLWMHRWKCEEPLIDRDLPLGVRFLAPSDWEALLALDREKSGLDRAAMLKHIAGEMGVKTLVAVEDAAITGYGMLRPGRVAAYIGPLVAKDLTTGEALFKAAVGSHTGKDLPIFIDTATGPALEEALHEEDFEIARTLTRMGRGTPGHKMAHGNGLFAIAGLELC